MMLAPAQRRCEEGVVVGVGGNDSHREDGGTMSNTRESPPTHFRRRQPVKPSQVRVRKGATKFAE